MINGVVDNAALSRFEMPIEGLLATAYYKRNGTQLILTHTEVPQELSGQGVATKLAEAVFQELRDRNQQVVLKCAFMSRFYSKHLEYSDLVVG
jgi:predicted GNAT family acetyltransferase